MTISTIILDDNPNDLRELRKLLSRIPEVELIESFSNPVLANIWMRENIVDLLISDIEMKEMSGLDLVDKVEHPPQVIFASSHSKYAAESFKLNPIHYLVKPIDEADLKTGIQRVVDKLQRNNLDEFIIIKVGYSEFHKVKIDDILFIEADDDYAKVILSNKEYRTHSTLKTLHARLPKMFLKTHRSYLVNANKISKAGGNTLHVNDYTIPLSRAYKQDVLKRI